MCTENNLNEILTEVLKHSKLIFSEKFVDVILYGSYARGDYTAESDIDIMVLAEIDSLQICDYLYQLRDRIYKLELKNDCVISLSIVPNSNFVRYKNVSPFYKNVAEEGIRFAG